MKTWRERCSAIKYLIVFLCSRFSFAEYKINYALTYTEAILVVLFLYSSKLLSDSGSSTPGDQERIMFYYHVETKGSPPNIPAAE